jgi:hypothetical protein
VRFSVSGFREKRVQVQGGKAKRIMPLAGFFLIPALKSNL